jgi:hypothetical protein
VPTVEVNGLRMYYEDHGAGPPLVLILGLGIRRAHVLGLSLGGRIAMDLALRYPEMGGTSWRPRAAGTAVLGYRRSGCRPSFCTA